MSRKAFGVVWEDDEEADGAKDDLNGHGVPAKGIESTLMFGGALMMEKFGLGADHNIASFAFDAGTADDSPDEEAGRGTGELELRFEGVPRLAWPETQLFDCSPVSMLQRCWMSPGCWAFFETTDEIASYAAD